MGGAAGGAVAGIMIANNMARLKAGIEAAEGTWPSLVGRGFSVGKEGDRPVLTGTLDGFACTVNIVTDFVFNPHTEVTATIAGGVAGKVGAYPSPSGLLKGVRDWLHQDVDIGDPEFDEAFLITSKPNDVAARLLSQQVREWICMLMGGKLIGFRYDGARAQVLLNGVESDTGAIETALDIVCTAARLSQS